MPIVLKGQAARDYIKRMRERINVLAEGSSDSPYWTITLLHPDNRRELYGRMTLSKRQRFDLFARPEDYAAILSTSERLVADG